MLAFPLVVSDFDGTLCHRDKSVSDYTRAVIRAYRAAGGIFTVATGRMFEGIRSQWEKLGIDEDIPVISYQGGLIRTALSQVTLHSVTLPKSLAAQILTSCRTLGLDAQGYHRGKVIVETDFHALEFYLTNNVVSRVLVPDLVAFAHQFDMRKVLVHLPESEFDSYLDRFKRTFGHVCNVCRSSRTYLEFFPFEAGKGNALKFLAERYSVPIEGTLAFGDQYNDLDLLAEAGRGIAVANAVDALKIAADAVTLSNDLDGVAHAVSSLNGLDV